MAQSASRSKYWLALFVVCAAAAFVASCDKGLVPSYEETGFEGIIHYANWPADISQVQELRLLAFDFVPTDSTDLVQLLLASVGDPGHVVLYPRIGVTGLPKFVDTTHYKVTTAGTTLRVRQYVYIVLAQRYGPPNAFQWKPAGVYTFNQATFEPAPILVGTGRLIRNVDIYVDFTKPPPKPWH